MTLALTGKSRRRIGVLGLVALVAVLGATLFAISASGGKDAAAAKEDKVTICHRTDSNTNPYVVESPSASGVYHGHLDYPPDIKGHAGPVWDPSLKDEGEKWGDIIPPFEFDGKTYSQNWADGEAIWENDCVVPSEELAHIQIVKVVVDSDADPNSFLFNIQESEHSGVTQGTYDVDPTNGPFDVVETNSTGFTVGYDNCTDLAPLAGETVTCTVTNTAQQTTIASTVTIVKEVSGLDEGETWSFDFDSDLNAQPDFTLTNDQPSQTVSNLTNQSFSITEGEQSGFELTGIVCTEAGDADLTGIATVGESGVLFNMANAEKALAITCTFSNEVTVQPETSTVHIVKEVSGATEWSFDFTSDLSAQPNFTLTNDAPSQDIPGLTNESFSIAEVPKDGFELTGLTCSDANDADISGVVTEDDEAGSVLFDFSQAEGGMDITCTFTNGPAVAAESTVTIAKDAGGDTSTDFRFSTEGLAAMGDFGSILDVSGDFSISGGESQTFGSLGAGSFTISEDSISGWTLSGVSCSAGDLDMTELEDMGVVSLSGSTLSFDLAADSGLAITCTFTNAPAVEQATLVINKVVDNNDNPAFTLTAADFAFDVSSNGTVVKNDVAAGSFSLDAGDYVVAEVDSKGYTTTYSGACSSTGAVTVVAGQSVTCTVTNTAPAVVPGTLVINKVVDNNDNPAFTLTAADFAFDVSSNGTVVKNDVAAGSFSLDAGDYVVAEVDSKGYTTTYSGACSSTGAVTVVAGQSVTCTVTNTAPAVEQGTLVIDKVVNNNDNPAFTLTPADFTFDVTSNSTVVKDNVSEGQYDLNAGAYVVTEVDSKGYTTTYSGACDSTGNVTVVAGQSVTCTVTNTAPAVAVAAETPTEAVAGVRPEVTPAAPETGTGTASGSNSETYFLFIAGILSMAAGATAFAVRRNK